MFISRSGEPGNEARKEVTCNLTLFNHGVHVIRIKYLVGKHASCMVLGPEILQLFRGST